MSASSPLPSSPPITPTYVVKRIMFKGKKVPVALQNTNGPCPLLAVANILSLRGYFSIHDDKSVVTADELLAAVSDYLFDTNSTASDALRRNHERNVSDVIQMLPNTLVGIDVNLKFDTITSFEFNSDVILFDFCNMRLVHGWLVDPQDAGYAFIRPLSYNQLVDKELEKISSNPGMRSPPRNKLHIQGSPSMANINMSEISPRLAKLYLSSEPGNSGDIAGPSNAANRDGGNVNWSSENMPKQSFQSNPSTTTTTTTTTTSSTADYSNVDNQHDDAVASSSSTPVKPNSPSTLYIPDKATQALLAEQFLNETATQLTYFGLTELHTGLQDEELCVFFRNNHFNTLYKHEGELFVLVTDQGYAREPVVWERLCQIDGDSTFLCSDFTPYQASSPVLVQDGIAQSIHKTEDSDLALAIQLQNEENKRKPPKTAHDGEHKHRSKREHCIMQ